MAAPLFYVTLPQLNYAVVVVVAATVREEGGSEGLPAIIDIYAVALLSIFKMFIAATL